ncbi:MAG: hypothetical protein J5950_03140 [Clostridia bacterium]|nr:hypothetical protein [Clostridia bacterium]
MIIRNSIKSVIRSPLKSILFFLLILALVSALTLGSALVSMCSALVRQCDQTYTTIASIEYRGGRFPDKTVSDASAARIRSQIDFEALGQKEYVKAVDQSDTAIVSFPNFTRILTENTSSEDVIVLTARFLYEDKNMAKVEKALYATELSEERLINIFVRESDGTRVPFKGEAGHTYLISGYTNGNSSGVVDVYLSNVLNETAYNTGIVQNTYYVDVTNDRKLENGDQAYDFFIDAAEAYQLVNHSWYARISSDPSFLETFVEKDYSVREGWIYTEKDAENGVYCMLPDVVADRWQVKPGDEVTLYITQTGFSSISDSFWPGVKGIGTENDETSGSEDDLYGSLALKCTLSAIITTTAREVPLVYLSGLGDFSRGDGFCGYTLGTLKLKNGISSEEVNELKSMMPEGAELAVYDQGYAGVTESLRKLRGDALGVVAAAIVASLAMLVLFAYVFVGRQSDTIVTMYLMGTPVRSLTAYVAIAAAMVLVPASLAAIIVSGSLSNVLSWYITRTVAEGQSTLRMYSSASLGISEPMSATVPMPIWPGLLCAVSLSILGLIACLIFLHIALKPVSPDAYKVKLRKKTAAAKPKNAKPLKMSGAARKYVLLSLKRGGIRTFAIPLVSVLMALFILVPAKALSSYRSKVKDLNDSTRIDCYFTDYGGKRRYDLVLMENMLGNITESGYFEDFHMSSCDPFIVTHTLKDPETEGGEEIRTEYAPDAAGSGFSVDSYVANLMNGPKIFYTDDFSSVPEFVGKPTPEITWLEGYGPDYFTEERSIREIFKGLSYRMYNSDRFYIMDDLRDLCVVVPESFLEEYNVSLGDRVGLTVSQDLVKEVYKIIGVFKEPGNSGFIYTQYYNAFKVLTFIVRREGLPDGIEKQVKDRSSYSCGTFKLTDTSKIREAKQWLFDNGYSRVHTAGYYRLYPIFEDQEYCEALEKLERNIGYLEKVLPAIAVLVLISGFTAAYLLMFRRKVEIATLRSIGETSRRVFSIFCFEQVLGALIGTALCIGLWIAFAGAGGAVWLAASFFAGFLAGTLISASRMSRNNLLEVLSDKE